MRSAGVVQRSTRRRREAPRRRDPRTGEARSRTQPERSRRVFPHLSRSPRRGGRGAARNARCERCASTSNSRREHRARVNRRRMGRRRSTRCRNAGGRPGIAKHRKTLKFRESGGRAGGRSAGCDARLARARDRREMGGGGQGSPLVSSSTIKRVMRPAALGKGMNAPPPACEQATFFFDRPHERMSDVRQSKKKKFRNPMFGRRLSGKSDRAGTFHRSARNSSKVKISRLEGYD